MHQQTIHPASSEVVLACDVGGTNTTVAILSGSGRSFTIVRRFPFATRDLTSLEEALDAVMERLCTPGSNPTPTALCISGAGPVRNNRCDLTNVPWKIDGDTIASRLGMPVRVINDFTAVSFGIPLLSITDAAKIGALTPAGIAAPEPEGSVRAVVGAGTGLGMGYVVDHHDEYLALPSEGGHAPFAPYDDRSRELLAYVTERESGPPGAECFVSGQGIGTILQFFRATGRLDQGSILNDNSTADPARRVSEAARDGDRSGREIMEFFVDTYARVAAAAALHFLPLAGLYLAGGIVTKNEQWFTEGDRFMRSFRQNYLKNIEEVLLRVPVYVVRDYEVSLYGAAYGASLLLKEQEQ